MSNVHVSGNVVCFGFIGLHFHQSLQYGFVFTISTLCSSPPLHSTLLPIHLSAPYHLPHTVLLLILSSSPYRPLHTILLPIPSSPYCPPPHTILLPIPSSAYRPPPWSSSASGSLALTRTRSPAIGHLTSLYHQTWWLSAVETWLNRYTTTPSSCCDGNLVWSHPAPVL